MLEVGGDGIYDIGGGVVLKVGGDDGEISG